MVGSQGLRHARRRWLVWSLVGFAACASVPYAPCPVELEAPLPPDAFAVCKRVLGRRFGGVTIADEAAFLLQSSWVPVAERPGERRASVFCEGGELAVLVESRWLSEPVIGLPAWSAVRGDPAAERELAAALRAELAPTVPVSGNDVAVTPTGR